MIEQEVSTHSELEHSNEMIRRDLGEGWFV